MPDAGVTTAPTALGAVPMGLLLCCLGLTMTEGFDTQAIGFVGPAILHDWHVPPSSLGPIFSAGLFGGMVGSALGNVGDRFGLLLAITLSTLLFAVGTVLTAWAADPGQLIMLRLVTGLGLGGTLPNVLSLAASQAPSRFRSTSLAVVLIGMPLGASLGGFASVTLIASEGWRSVFILGGLAPLPALALLWTLRRDIPAPGTLGASGREAGGRFATVLAPRYRVGTLILWAITCFSVMLTYTLTNWLPTLLNERGLSQTDAVLASVVLNLGAVAGGVGVGRLSDLRSPFKVLFASYVLGAAAIALIGVATGAGPIFAVTFAAAVLALGGQTGIGMLSTLFYEPSVRATGVGVGLFFGRLGAVFGPLMIGGLMAAGAGIPTLFLWGGGVALVIAVLVGAMARAVVPPHRAVIIDKPVR